MQSNGQSLFFRIFLLLAVSALLSSAGCASSKKYRFDISNPKASCDMAHMGKNKYFYSNHYQKILRKSKRRISNQK
jgi:hypothetical protein